MNDGPVQPYTEIFAKGEMADRTRSFNWAATDLGPIASWPVPLLTTVNLILDSSFPMFIWWGNEKIQFYNDAYLQILGTDEKSKHPQALGQQGPECWKEIWPVISPMLQKVLDTGEAIYLEDQLIPIYRSGKLDEVYWTFSYNVIRSTGGSAGGILVICTETTKKVKFEEETITGLQKQQSLNEEVATVNEELTATNEELSRAQDELTQSNIILEHRVNDRIKELAEVNARLTIALDAGSLGYTEVDLATGTMSCNEQFKKFFGRQKHEEFTYPQMFEAMLPKYREDIRNRVTFAKENRSLYQAVYEVAWPDGSIHWISAHGRARYNEAGVANRMVGILTDVTEQKKEEQRKNDFIGMVSHELKTPVTSLNAYLQVLQTKAKTLPDAFFSNAIDKSVKQVKKMTTMINGFLNVSRLESGQIRIDKQRFDMALLVKDTEEESVATISSHQIVFAPVHETFVMADRDKIGHVINNFITNAVKYSPNGSIINVACVTVNGQVQLSVTDQGIGVAQQDIPKLFDRYYRVANVGNVSGFGIGLYLCAEILKHHHGKIWVESEIGKGSTFCFSLPVSE